MSRIVLAGGSGFLGKVLAGELARRGWEIVNLTRSPRSAVDSDVAWDGVSVGEWSRCLDGAAALVNLTGRSVDCRYNRKNRAEIVDSRINSVRAVGTAIRRSHRPPPVWVQASSLAIYGDAAERVCDEDAPHGEGFSVQVCQQWERATAEESTPATRKVILRIGFVLGGGGVLEKLARLARLGLGGTVGAGRQWISWIHVDDLNRMILWAIDNDFVSGVYHATGPTPTRNNEFMRELRRALGVWFGPWAPSLAVRIGCFFLRTEASLALTGRRCIPARALRQGFPFAHTDLRQSLQELAGMKQLA